VPDRLASGGGSGVVGVVFVTFLTVPTDAHHDDEEARASARCAHLLSMTRGFYDVNGFSTRAQRWIVEARRL
jgi:hypothetical protein